MQTPHCLASFTSDPQQPTPYSPIAPPHVAITSMACPFPPHHAALACFSSHRTAARLSSHKPAAAPVRIISIARLLPTARVRRCVPPMPGITPREISGCAAMGKNIRGRCAVTCSCCLCRGSCSRNLELRANEMAQRMPQRCAVCAARAVAWRRPRRGPFHSNLVRCGPATAQPTYLPKLRFVGGQDDVTHHGQLAAAAQRIAIDRSNDGLAHSAAGAGELCERQQLEAATRQAAASLPPGSGTGCAHVRSVSQPLSRLLL